MRQQYTPILFVKSSNGMIHYPFSENFLGAGEISLGPGIGDGPERGMAYALPNMHCNHLLLEFIDEIADDTDQAVADAPAIFIDNEGMLWAIFSPKGSRFVDEHMRINIGELTVIKSVTNGWIEINGKVYQLAIYPTIKAGGQIYVS